MPKLLPCLQSLSCTFDAASEQVADGAHQMRSLRSCLSTARDACQVRRMTWNAEGGHWKRDAALRSLCSRIFLQLPVRIEQASQLVLQLRMPDILAVNTFRVPAKTPSPTIAFEQGLQYLQPFSPADEGQVPFTPPISEGIPLQSLQAANLILLQPKVLSSSQMKGTVHKQDFAQDSEEHTCMLKRTPNKAPHCVCVCVWGGGGGGVASCEQKQILCWLSPACML